MLRITVNGVTFPDFDDDRMAVSEAIALEKVSGLTAKEMYDGVNRFSGEGLRALVWLVQRRADPATCPRYSTLDFDLADFDMVTVDEDGNPIEPGQAGDQEPPDPSPAPDSISE